MPEQHSYTFEPYLQNGYYYQFLAIGRDDKYATKKVLTEPEFTKNVTKLEDARIALTEEAKNSANPGILNTTELFSGILQDENTHMEAPVLVTEETKYFHRTLTASRNVAGLMIYVETSRQGGVECSRRREPCYLHAHLSIRCSHRHHHRNTD